MLEPRNYLFDLPDNGRPEPLSIPEELYPGVRDHWGKSTTSRKFDPLTGIRGVVIHATAGGSSSGAMSVMKAHKASWHWLVPDENEIQHGKLVWACAPETRAAWHVQNSKFHPDVNNGKNLINHWTVGIEIVNTQKKTPVDGFSEWQVDVTAQIVRYCWAKYPNLKHVFSHALVDPQRRTDPGKNFPWEEFKEKILNGKMEKSKSLVASALPMSELTANPDIALCCMSGN
ncbi:MAG: N-acetylmuramoyl-L-alanine amidase [Planctomycetaceae bacterium]|nr:N-acetylmuramoyl-L-alanine amidase [Planctomycetaceae bacterium]